MKERGGGGLATSSKQARKKQDVIRNTRKMFLAVHSIVYTVTLPKYFLLNLTFQENALNKVQIKCKCEISLKVKHTIWTFSPVVLFFFFFFGLIRSKSDFIISLRGTLVADKWYACVTTTGGDNNTR